MNSLKSFEEWEKDYYNNGRPVEPFSESENAEQWSAIAFYAETKLQEAFVAGQKSVSNSQHKK